MSGLSPPSAFAMPLRVGHRSGQRERLQVRRPQRRGAAELVDHVVVDVSAAQQLQRPAREVVAAVRAADRGPSTWRSPKRMAWRRSLMPAVAPLDRSSGAGGVAPGASGISSGGDGAPSARAAAVNPGVVGADRERDAAQRVQPGDLRRLHGRDEREVRPRRARARRPGSPRRRSSKSCASCRRRAPAVASASCDRRRGLAGERAAALRDHAPDCSGRGRARERACAAQPVVLDDPRAEQRRRFVRATTRSLPSSGPSSASGGSPSAGVEALLRLGDHDVGADEVVRAGSRAAAPWPCSGSVASAMTYGASIGTYASACAGRRPRAHPCASTPPQPAAATASSVRQQAAARRRRPPARPAGPRPRRPRRSVFTTRS